MPRQSRGPSRAPSRPAAPPPRPAAPQQQQTRPASTAAYPPAGQQQAQTPAQQQGGRAPGLFGQMASTAAGVAVGSSIGHAIGGFFGGGSSQEAAPSDPAMASPYDNNNAGYSQQTSQQQQACQPQVLNFRQCMDQNQGDLNICGWYLDQLKACQQAAAPY